MGERIEIGWKSLAAMLRKSPTAMQRRRQELERVGVIFYMRHGKPGRRMVHFWPSLLQRWVMLKTTKGEPI
jgi:hypothetical protein